MSITQEHLKKILLFVLSVIVVSFFFYPLQLRQLPMNTKTIMAGLGVLVVLIEIAKSGRGVIRKDLLVLSVFAIGVSFFSLLAITVNNTPDTTYVTYIISMWVWLSAAYASIWFVRKCFGHVDITLLCNLLIWASLIECMSALLIDLNPWFHDFVARFTDHRWTESVNRLYGISAELDTAGIHFSVTLVLIAYVLCRNAERFPGWKICFYWLSFIAITVIGNMIARTTLAGAGLAVLYFIWKSGILNFRFNTEMTRVFKIAGVMLIISIPVIIYYYNTNDRINENLRFGFEGFFSLAEKGEWEVASNNTLKSMVVWPETMHTWLLGDGYIVNPKFIDPHYVGEITMGYYKNTDIGFLRFIFYFGLPGLLTFSAFIIMAGVTCARRLPGHNALLLGLVVLNFIIWCKVSTDIFFIFALLYCIDAVREDENDTPLVKDDVVVKV